MGRLRLAPAGAVWHLLQLSGSPELEMAKALADLVKVIAWRPEVSLLGGRRHPCTLCDLSAEASLTMEPLTLLQHGELPQIPLLQPLSSNLLSAGLLRRVRAAGDPQRSTLVCTRAHYAPVAERWPGPVVFWPEENAPLQPTRQRRKIDLERRLCQVATLVCARSREASHSLVHLAHCDPDRMTLLPEATRLSALLPFPPMEIPSMPGADRNIPRPIAGVVAESANEIDWAMLETVVTALPWLSWVFIGVLHGELDDPYQRAARENVMAQRTTYFLGDIAEDSFDRYARALDVAVLPYRQTGRGSPAYYAGSRFYNLLAACRPMLMPAELAGNLPAGIPLRKTRGVDEMVDALADLRRHGFDDGHSAARWELSRASTWQVRARAMQHGLAERLSQVQPEADLVMPFSRAGRP